MQKYCSVKGCKSLEGESPDVTFLKFPLHEDAEVLDCWRGLVDRPGWQPDADSLLCSKHFAPDSFVPGTDLALRPGAVPTLTTTHQTGNMMDLDYKEFLSHGEYEEADDEDAVSEGWSAEDYCRLCATRGCGKLYPMFGHQGEQWRIVEKIGACLPITVSQSDRISLHICAGCMRKLNASYNFIILALESDASFQEKFPADWWSQARVPFMECNSDEEDSDHENPVVKEEFVSVKTEFEDEEESGLCYEMEEVVDDDEGASQGLVGSGGTSLRIDGPATCDICSRTFADMAAFDGHVMHEHRSHQRWPCTLCDLGFDQPDDLLAHKITMHLDELAACDGCARVAGFRCHECDCEFSTAAETHDHCLAHSTLVCKVHSEQHLLGTDCKCCEMTAAKKQHDKIHPHGPSRREQLRCSVCRRPCRDAAALRNHTALHTGDKMHMCDVCGRTYNRYANMLKHRKQHKPRALWQHRCEQCSNVFEQLRDLTAHLQNVHGLAPSTTDMAKKKSAVKWVCRFCGKVISTKLSLQDHERIHTGAKPFVCEWCGREFRSRPNLLQHHLTHTGDRRHACSICGKRFSRKSFITQHMRVHTGEKPFVCDICGHRFTQAGDMRRHRKRHVEAQEEVAVVLQLDPLH